LGLREDPFLSLETRTFHLPPLPPLVSPDIPTRLLFHKSLIAYLGRPSTMSFAIKSQHVVLQHAPHSCTFVFVLFH
jgi:hypothetical protein